jgi:hypothetical protein
MLGPTVVLFPAIAEIGKVTGNDVVAPAATVMEPTPDEAAQ